MPSKQNTSPFLTIGIASYNYAPYLLQAFEQIKKQEFRDFEILYCDDGSTDNSVAVIQKLIRMNPEINIRLIEGNNQGILANKNRILDHAAGRYLMICDADDFMLDTCLKELCEAAINTSADCIIGGFQELDKSGHILKSHIPAQNSCKWLYTWHHAQIYKTELLRQHKIRFEELPDDVAYLQKIHLHSQNTVFVSSVLYAWVRHCDSVSRDTATNPDWNPVTIWKKVSDCIAAIRESADEENDRRALSYYLYKWFYLNLADLNAENLDRLQNDIQNMRTQMRYTFPEYNKFSQLFYTLKTKDTLFARTAVVVCWIFEKLHLIQVLPFFRTRQNQLRNKRERYG